MNYFLITRYSWNALIQIIINRPWISMFIYNIDCNWEKWQWYFLKKLNKITQEKLKWVIYNKIFLSTHMCKKYIKCIDIVKKRVYAFKYKNKNLFIKSIYFYN